MPRKEAPSKSPPLVETCGVGLGLEAENVLSPQFAGRNAESFVYSKTGAVADNEVDAISSATITTNAYVNCVNACLEYFDIIISKGGN